MSRKIRYSGYSFASLPYPLQLAGAQLYLAKNVATPSLWNDQSPNAYDLSQVTSSKQPTIGTDTVDFDGVDDVLFRNITDAFISDSIGIMFFGFVWNGSDSPQLFNSADPTRNDRIISFQLTTGFGGGKLSIITIQGSAIDRVITTDDAIVGYNYGYIKSNGTSWEISLNGVVQTLTAPAGTNSGRWFSGVTLRENISIGAGLRLSEFYGITQLNKLYYNNTNLTPTEISSLNTFFSNPNNY